MRIMFALFCLTLSVAAHADYALELNNVQLTCVGENEEHQSAKFVVEAAAPGSESAKVTWTTYAFDSYKGYAVDETGTTVIDVPAIISEGSVSIVTYGKDLFFMFGGPEIQRLEKDVRAEKLDSGIYQFIGNFDLKGVSYDYASCSLTAK